MLKKRKRTETNGFLAAAAATTGVDMRTLLQNGKPAAETFAGTQAASPPLFYRSAADNTGGKTYHRSLPFVTVRYRLPPSILLPAYAEDAAYDMVL